jgi:Homeodomain-like domain
VTKLLELVAPARSFHRDYERRRARQIAYGRWDPWVDAAAVRPHIQALRRAGASYQAIARAAGVSPMTVYRIQHAQPFDGQRVRAVNARRLLDVTPQALDSAAARIDAVGSRRRLQALMAVGHPGADLARYLQVPPRTVWNLVSGTRTTVSPDLHQAIRELYDRMWDQRPSERTPAERRAAAAARTKAAARGWPTPMGLDDDLIDCPGYLVRTRWRPATGTNVRHLPQPRLRGPRAEPAPSRREAAL